MKAIRAHAGGPSYRPDIDGLRFIAVTSVVFYHAGLRPLTSGYVGVDIFFVISGFLIGGILHRDVRANKFSYADFYARRARRILPALMTVVILFCTLGFFLMGARELRQTGMSAAAALLGVSNFYFWWSTNYFSPASHLNPFLMTWSLGVEEQFYIFFPLLLLFLERFRIRIAVAVLLAISLASLVLSVIITARYPLAAFYLLPTRSWELGVGATLALLWDNPKFTAPQWLHELLGVTGLALTLLACVAFRDATPFPGYAALLPTTGALMLIFAQRSWVNQRVLSFPPFVGIGLVSYSWYLWHAPLMAYTRLVSFGSASTTLLSAIGIVSLGCAYLSWRFVEQPLRHRQLPNASALKRYGTALTACLTVPVMLAGLNGMPKRWPPQERAIEHTLADGQANPCLMPYGAAAPSADPRCAPAIPAGGRAAVLLGDSHAAALGSSLARLGLAQGVAVQQMEKSSCAPLIGAARAMPSHPAHRAECSAFNQAVFQRVAKDRSIGTVILAAYWSASFRGDPADGQLVGDRSVAADQPAILRMALTNTIRHYRAIGKQVIVLADVPLFRFDPAAEVIGDVLPLRRMLRDLLGKPADVAQGRAARRWLRDRSVADQIVAQVAAGEPGTRYVVPADSLCDVTSCAYAADLPYYLDFQHLTQPGAAVALADLKL